MPNSNPKQMETVIITAEQLKRALERGALSLDNNFSLKPDFAGEYVVEYVLDHKYNRSEDPNGFRLQLTHKATGRTVFIPDFHMMRSKLVDANIKGSLSIKVGGKDVDNVGYKEDNETLMAALTVGGASAEYGTDGELVDLAIPKHIEFVGALVDEVTDGDGSKHPALPLRFYKGYNQVLAYHRMPEHKNTSEYVNRDEFTAYLEDNAKGNIQINGVPKSLDKLVLANPKSGLNMRNWNHVLLLKDYTKEEEVVPDEPTQEESAQTTTPKRRGRPRKNAAK